MILSKYVDPLPAIDAAQPVSDPRLVPVQHRVLRISMRIGEFRLCGRGEDTGMGVVTVESGGGRNAVMGWRHVGGVRGRGIRRAGGDGGHGIRILARLPAP